MKSEVFRKGILGVFLLGLIVIFSGRAHALQWSKTYGGAGSDDARVAQQTSDGGYIVGGIIFGSSNDAYVAKLDASGNVIWQKTYGGAGNDGVADIKQTTDGGYIVGGWSTSFGAGNFDFWVLKLDASGNVTWQKTYGGGNADFGASGIQQTADGGYIATGGTQSFGAGNTDVWVLKLDSLGAVTWQKTYGGGSIDQAYYVQQTGDGGYIVAGRTSSSGAGGTDVWVLKLDSLGAVTWQKTYGGTGDENVNFVQQTTDGGYIVAGTTTSFGAGNTDAWILKLDASGNVTWQKTYGGAALDVANSIQQTADGGYIAAGWTASFGAGGLDVWVLKLDASGNVTFQKTYGGGGDDRASSVQQTSDGGYIVAGRTASSGAGSFDAWVLKLDANGNIPTCVSGTSSATVNVTSVVPVATAVPAPNSAAGSPTTNATIANSTATSAQVCAAIVVLPTVTVTKVSNGGVGAFSFTGSNGFANQTITTMTSGVGVAGATQALTADGVSTTITESGPPAGFALASIVCTGLGAGGTATPNLGTRTVTLDGAATAAGAAIGCTFTNNLPPPTAIPTLAEWALIMLAMLLLVTGWLQYRRRQ